MKLKQIGVIHSSFTYPAGTPIQPAFAHGAKGVIEVYHDYVEGLKDLDGFERIWLIYWLHKVESQRLLVKPYMDTTERGLFATRAPVRPNPIGMSSVKLEKVEENKIFISDVDILDGTPLIDIKPYSPIFDCFDVKKVGWLGQINNKNTKADDRFHKT